MGRRTDAVATGNTGGDSDHDDNGGLVPPWAETLVEYGHRGEALAGATDGKATRSTADGRRMPQEAVGASLAALGKGRPGGARVCHVLSISIVADVPTRFKAIRRLQDS